MGRESKLYEGDNRGYNNNNLEMCIFIPFLSDVCLVLYLARIYNLVSILIVSTTTKSKPNQLIRPCKGLKAKLEHK